MNVIAIRAFYFSKWLFGAHSIQNLCKFAHYIPENCPKSGLITQQWMRTQFKFKGACCNNADTVYVVPITLLIQLTCITRSKIKEAGRPITVKIRPRLSSIHRINLLLREYFIFSDESIFYYFWIIILMYWKIL